MADAVLIEVQLDKDWHSELVKEAERLGLTPEEIARRAVADWLGDVNDEARGWGVRD